MAFGAEVASDGWESLVGAASEKRVSSEGAALQIAPVLEAEQVFAVHLLQGQKERMTPDLVRLGLFERVGRWARPPGQQRPRPGC